MSKKCFSLIYLVVSFTFILQTACQENSKLTKEPSSTSGGRVEFQEEAANTPGLKNLSPKITFEKLVYDFGEVSFNSVHTGQIKFKNAGQAPLKITEVGKCCGLVAELDNTKKEYAPGESGILKVRWRSGSQPVVFKRQLMVHSNDPSAPVTSLTIQAKVVPKVVCEPKILRLSLDKKNAGCPKITVSSLDERPFSINAFKATGDCMIADLDTVASKTSHVIEPKVDMEKLPKNLKGRIEIGTTHPEAKTLTIEFDVVPEYSLEPPLIMVFNAEPGQSIIRKVVVLNNYDKDFEIESVSSRNNTVAIEVLGKSKVENGCELELKITIPPIDETPKFTEELSINLQGGKKLSLKFNGFYAKNAPKS
jgi:hypothetical protein